MNEYAEYGIRFEYPDDWEVDQVEVDGRPTITVTSVETSFWCLTIFADRPSLESVLAAAVAAFEEEYDEVDVYSRDAPGEICGEEAVARDVEFVCLELVNTAFIRAVTTDEFTLLVLYQGADIELPVTQSILEGITESLTAD